MGDLWSFGGMISGAEHAVSGAVSSAENAVSSFANKISSTARNAMNTLGNALGANKCTVVNMVCKTVCGKGIGSLGLCTADDALVVSTCEAVGLGPEDPAADVCAAAMGAAFEGICGAAVNEIGTLTGDACSKAFSC